MDGRVLNELSVTEALLFLDRNQPLRALEWLDSIPAASRPCDLLARCRDALAGVAADEGRWSVAVAEAKLACDSAPTSWRQERLSLLRSRRSLLSIAEFTTIRSATPLPGRLRPDSLGPQIGIVRACGAYYSRGAGVAAPWSRYLRLSKEPPVEDNERLAVFRLAAGYFAEFVISETDLLRRAEVVVPVPANPERYARRLASLPDQLAIGCEKALALRSHPFALDWAPESVHVEMKRLGRLERRQVAPSLFIPGKDCSAVTDRRVLLVDDLTTSGSTLRACARTLLDCGAIGVDACALAHTEG